MVVVVALFLFFGYQSNYFVSASNVTNILLSASVVGLLALGQTFVLITGGIDLSVGSIVGVTAVVAGILSQQTSPVVALVGGVLVGGVAGLINGVLITTTKITPFIVTLGTMSIYAGLALIITGGQAIYGIPDGFQDLLAGELLGVPVPIVLFVLLTATCSLAMKYTRFGEYLIAVGGNAEVARLAGIGVSKIMAGSYVLSGAFAGLAGAVLAARLGAADPTLGGDLLLVAIAAAVMGGTKLIGGEGSMVGGAFGAILIATLTAGLTSMNVQAFYQKVAVGSAIIITILIDQFARRRPS